MSKGRVLFSKVGTYNVIEGKVLYTTIGAVDRSKGGGYEVSYMVYSYSYFDVTDDSDK